MKKELISALLIGAGMLAAIQPVQAAEEAEREALQAQQLAMYQQVEADRAAELARWAEIESRIPELPEKAEDPAPAPEPYNDPEIPDDVEQAAIQWGTAYGIAPELLEAVAFHESTYRAGARNGGCCGLMQISARWHGDRMERLGMTEADLWDANHNMHLAADYLRELFDRHESVDWALMTYNGDVRADSVLEGSAPSAYASGITAMAAELTEKHEREVMAQ